MITFVCSKCHAAFKAAESQVGARGVCGRCGQSIQVPPPGAGNKPVKLPAVPVATEAPDMRREHLKRPAIPLWLVAFVLAGGILFVGIAGALLAIALQRGPQATALEEFKPGPQNSGPQTISAADRNHPAAERQVGEEMRFGDLGIT